MDIKSLARKPELIKVEINDQDIVDTYGEAVTFYIRDYVDLPTYFDFFRSQNEKKGEELAEILRRLILNEKGEPVLGPEDQLPIDIMISTLVKINETLGKSGPKSLTKKAGTQQK